MDINYRQFTMADAASIAGLMKSLNKEDQDKPINDEKIKRTLDELFNHPDKGTIMVLETDKQIIGYAILINFWSNEFGGNIVEMDELYIKEDFRGKGIGTDFIKYLIAQKPSHAVALQLEVSPTNKRARALYEKLGFSLHKNSTLTLELD